MNDGVKLASVLKKNCCVLMLRKNLTLLDECHVLYQKTE